MQKSWTNKLGELAARFKERRRKWGYKWARVGIGGEPMRVVGAVVISVIHALLDAGTEK